MKSFCSEKGEKSILNKKNFDVDFDVPRSAPNSSLRFQVSRTIQKQLEFATLNIVDAKTSEN